MREKEFINALKEEHLKLDQFFHRKLRQIDKRYNKEFQNTKDDLIHETAVAVWTKLHNPSSNPYEIQTLVWLCAPDVWKRYIKPKTQPIQYMPIEEIELLAGAYDIALEVDAADYLSYLENGTHSTDWQMINLNAQGYTFNEISTYLSLSESLVKKRVYLNRSKYNDSRKSDSDTNQ